ncbi:hypothetical protein [Streptomyces sp. NPDC001340]
MAETERPGRRRGQSVPMPAHAYPLFRWHYRPTLTFRTGRDDDSDGVAGIVALRTRQDCRAALAIRPPIPSADHDGEPHTLYWLFPYGLDYLASDLDERRIEISAAPVKCERVAERT